MSIENDTKKMLSNFKVRKGLNGFHFFDRTTGINILQDECIPLRKTWSKAPRQVSIALTNACDLSCAHCYAPKFSAQIKFDHLIAWSKDLDKNGCLGIGFGGGEPTLYPRFLDLCEILTKETKLAITMTTHGHHLDEAYGERLKGNIHFIRISMDGTGSVYEKIRKRSYNQLIKKMLLVKKIAPFGINFLVNSTTFKCLDSAINIASTLGVSEFLLLPEKPTKSTVGIDSKTLQHLHEWILQYSGSVPLAINEFDAAELPIFNGLSEEPSLCSYVHIDASSNLRPTSYSPLKIQIRDTRILEALEILQSGMHQL